MNKALLTILLFLPIFASAQKSLIVFPYTGNEESFCENYNVYNTKMAIQAIEEIYKENEYTIIDTKSPMRRIQAEGECELSNIDIQASLLGGWQNYYIEVSYKLHKTTKGNYFDLYLLYRESSTKNVLVAYKKTSEMRFSSSIKEFTHLLFEEALKEFTTQCQWAKGRGTSIAISNMRIPSIAPLNRSKPKVSKPIADTTISTPTKKITAPVSETFPLSDVDQNIPNFGKVNEHAVAVVIGNRHYRNKDVPEVSFAINDAKFMKAYLKNSFGFKEGNIIYVEDATLADFNAIFGIKGNNKGKLFNYVKPNVSDVFVFYSGHGAPNPETNKGYFVPVDTDPSLIQFNGYSLDTFYENLGLVPYKKLTVVIDACFSGSSEGGMLLQAISPVFIKSENKVLRDENAVILTSAASEQVSSWYTEKYHSLFTYYYLKGLQGDADLNKDQKVTLKEMYQYIGEHVPYMARRLNNREQTPEITGSEDTILIER